jgi:hypothetical protein
MPDRWVPPGSPGSPAERGSLLEWPEQRAPRALLGEPQAEAL